VLEHIDNSEESLLPLYAHIEETLVDLQTEIANGGSLVDTNSSSPFARREALIRLSWGFATAGLVAFLSAYGVFGSIENIRPQAIIGFASASILLPFVLVRSLAWAVSAK
jgi:hypothetical protein